MKTPIRFLFIILTLGLFSSCAEQFREIRGSENQGNAFLGGGLTSSTATKRTDKATGERVTPQQTVIPVEQAASDIEAQSAPAPNPIEPIVEKLETNQSRFITGQKGSVSSKHNSSSSPTLKKRKSLKPAKFLKQAISRKDNRNSAQSFLESPYFGGSIGDWLLYINVILSFIIIGLLLIYAFIDWTVLLGIIPALIPLGISLYQYLIRESLYEERGLFRFSFWLIAASFFVQLITSPLANMQWTQNGPPVWSLLIFALLMLGLGLHVLSYIDKFFEYLFDSWSDKHWFVRLLLGIVFCLIAFIVLWALIYGSQI
jgi:hypothetical protein